MSHGQSASPLRHLAGLALALLLGVAAVGIWVYVPSLLRGTFLQRFEILSVFLCLIALLSIADRVWVLATTRLQRHPPG